MHYQKHLFFCTNLRSNGAKCCQDGNASALCHYAKERLQQLKCYGPGKFRISSSGCLGRCALGPSLVIYPEGIWYRYQSQQDLDLIIESHLLGGKIVTQLLMSEATL